MKKLKRYSSSSLQIVRLRCPNDRGIKLEQRCFCRVGGSNLDAVKNPSKRIDTRLISWAKSFQVRTNRRNMTWRIECQLRYHSRNWIVVKKFQLSFFLFRGRLNTL
ncbi:hypothetical protein TNIN_334281 [Trichonephila inaurata madagascariensis]|uniref:Uncharacterized protein n=1 Tax=Trichonephila inaurata madagascariensis TaxID=2747483 RepID=A0A8X7CAN7_9ARAC|nr:hypothetical protein TNIN_334281 [Trichonephila inaurata madagascariensis]